MIRCGRRVDSGACPQGRRRRFKSYPHLKMTPTQFIQKELEGLKEFHKREVPKEQLADEIFRLLMSKKFRKYSANQELVEHIKNAIKLNIEKNQPLNLTFPHGAYKLWRLEEYPLPDWAELFTFIYYTTWLKPICEIYKPGVWFDFFVDDFIVPIINNTPTVDVYAYLKEEQNLLDFMKKYQPENLKITITQFKDQYSTPESFEKDLQESVKKLEETNPTFTKEELRSVELNAKPTSEQLIDPKWREKIKIIHDAYMPLKRETKYYYRPDKIPVFCQPLPSGKFLIVGTTKRSIAKFWVGVGVVIKDGDTYHESILSPKQLEASRFIIEKINIEGLSSKNFKSIRII